MVQTVLGLDDYRDGEYWNTYAGLTEVPGDIPAETRKVFLFNNPITDVSPWGLLPNVSVHVPQPMGL